MNIILSCVLLTYLPATHGALEFGRNSYERPISQRKRILGLEYVPNGWMEEQKLTESRILEE
jgi:hypothetical protein